jgi:hypothetical protein
MPTSKIRNSPRQIAKENGDKFYEGNPCKKGHTKRRTLDYSCVECNLLWNLDWYRKNKEEILKKNKIYKAKPENKKRHAAWKMERRNKNPVIRVQGILSRQLGHFTKRRGETKTGRTEELLGYTAKELNTHLESLFKDGMTWANQGEWHIDHRIPQSYFTSIDQLKECFALSNLKPEWASWNISKGNRFIG